MGTEDKKADLKAETPPPAPKEKKDPALDVIYTYVGPGYIPGVPTRDLERWEWDRLPADLAREVAHSGSYKKGGE